MCSLCSCLRGAEWSRGQVSKTKGQGERRIELARRLARPLLHPYDSSYSPGLQRRKQAQRIGKNNKIKIKFPQCCELCQQHRPDTSVSFHNTGIIEQG